MVAAKKTVNANGGHYTVYGFDPSFMRWTVPDAVNVVKHHWLPCFFAVGLLFFMAVEYTLRMVPASSPPFDLGFLATSSLHSLLSSWPELNTLLAALNTVFIFRFCRFMFRFVSDFLICIQYSNMVFLVIIELCNRACMVLLLYLFSQ